MLSKVAQTHCLSYIQASHVYVPSVTLKAYFKP